MSIHGKLLFLIYYRPRNFIRWISRTGVRRSLDLMSGKKSMEKAARMLRKPQDRDFEISLDVHFLTGREYWYQSLFCAYTFSKHTNCDLRPILHDDGTLREKDYEIIKSIFPRATKIEKYEVDRTLDSRLPSERFPKLRGMREKFIMMRKLIDIHFVDTTFTLYMDSDMLFHDKCDDLLSLIRRNGAFFLNDVKDSYVDSREKISAKINLEVFSRVNAGFQGLESRKIDWNEMEFWLGAINDGKPHYYLEQTLFACLASRFYASRLDTVRYIVDPIGEVHNGCSLIHYVAESKPWYFSDAWRSTVNDQ